MPNYRRVYIPGGTFFFTVNLLCRGDNDLLVRHVDVLRDALRKVIRKYPFTIHAWVVLPDHLHCIWQLPDDDSDNASRWRLIKRHFSTQIASNERLSDSRINS